MNKKEQRLLCGVDGDKREFKMVSLSKLILEDFGLDSSYQVEKLEAEIKQNGLMQPISVIGPFRSGEYRVIDGARRVNALRNLIYDMEIPCYIIGDSNVDPKKAKRLALAMNSNKRTESVLLKLRYAESVYRLVMEQKLPGHKSTGLLCSLTGMGERMARKYVRVVELGCPKLQEQVASGDLGIDEAHAIVNAVAGRKQVQYADIVISTPRGCKKLIVDRIKNGQDISNNKKIVARFQCEKQIVTAGDNLKKLLSAKIEKDDKQLLKLLKVCEDFIAQYQ